MHLTGKGVGLKGRVTGRARLIMNYDDLKQARQGEILIASTASAWFSPLMSLAAGVVTESGGRLTHAATLCREFNLPGVVGVQGLCKCVNNHDLLIIDSEKGLVEVVKDELALPEPK